MRQHYPGGYTIKNDACIACMTMINPDIGWFEIFKVMTFDLDKATEGNCEYIDK